MYHRPVGVQPRTALIATHYNIDFSEHYLASFLAERGYGFLGWNTRFRGNEPYFVLDHALAEIGVGVHWLREQAGVERVVLLGNSGGGSLMAAYQSQAVEPNVRASNDRTAQAISGLPAADLYISLTAHPGRPEVLTAWMDPSVTDETDPLSCDPELDPFDPANGPPFDAGFQRRYRAAQRARNEAITDWALAELESLRPSRARDRLFVVPRTWADLRMIDPSIEPSDRAAGQCYLGDPKAANYGVFGIGVVSTLRTWLSMWSLRMSQCAGAEHLPRIRVPALVLQAAGDAGVYDSDAEGILAALGVGDRRLETLPGDHYFTGPGARDHLADVIVGWLGEHAG